ncbi:4Fe-4S binding protein [Dehalococcoidia bacterium]|nr:4Fe-4S binding protein [Dehalococcoidia bacterium]
MPQARDVKVFKNWCKRCGVCVALCPKQALATGADGQPFLNDEQACNGCGLCELRCPDFAIMVYDDER